MQAPPRASRRRSAVGACRHEPWVVRSAFPPAAKEGIARAWEASDALLKWLRYASEAADDGNADLASSAAQNVHIAPEVDLPPVFWIALSWKIPV